MIRAEYIARMVFGWLCYRALLRDSQHLLGEGPACDDHHIKVRAFLAKLEEGK